MNANGLYDGLEGYIVPGTNSGMGNGVANGLVNNESKLLYKYVLDLSPNAAVAFSLRKLRNGYTGPAIRVRRSSDNSELDIGFDGIGNLDVNLLTSFVGANSGFVTTWYDQSGNLRHMTQTTLASQPRIVNAGTVERENNLPTINFADSTDQMTHPYPLSSQADVYYVFKSTNSTYCFHWSTSVSIYGYFVQSGSSGTNISATYGTPTLHINGQQFSGTTRNDLFVSYGGAFRISSVMNADLSNTAWGTIRLSGYTAIAATLLGPVSEYIIYSRTQTNRPAIENNINQYYKIY
jgi:hypothetical protein